MAMRVLMLVSDAHGGAGGIAQYNRDIISAMSRLSTIKEIRVLPRIIHNAAFEAPANVTYDLSTAKSTRHFLVRAAAQAFVGRRYDLVYCAHINLMPIATLLARMRRVPLVLAIYGVDAWEPPPSAAARWCVGVPSLVISISQVTLDRFRAWSGLDAARCVVLPNAIHMCNYGLGPKDSPLARRLGLADRPVVLTFGRMAGDERYKGFDEIIDLMPRLLARAPDLAYVAAGEGSDRARLEAKAKALGVNAHVVFPGHIAESEKADLYRLADAYVMPSSGEGFGFVILEALACGIPVVASSSDGTREAVRSGELGLVVNPQDADELERAVIEAMSRPKMIPPALEYFSFPNFERRFAVAFERMAIAA
jgi:glycosyltransferase involved in cell wall biosynthesis